MKYKRLINFEWKGLRKIYYQDHYGLDVFNISIPLVDDNPSFTIIECVPLKLFIYVAGLIEPQNRDKDDYTIICLELLTGKELLSLIQIQTEKNFTNGRDSIIERLNFFADSL